MTTDRDPTSQNNRDNAPLNHAPTLCPLGHAVGETDRFCSICGERLDDTRSGVSVASASFPTYTPGPGVAPYPPAPHVRAGLFRARRRRPWRQQLFITLAIILVLVIGLGVVAYVSQKEDMKSADQIWADAKAASTAATSVHVFGTRSSAVGSSVQNVSIDYVASRAISGGSYVAGTAAYKFVITPSAIYANANAAFWQQALDSASEAQALEGKWIELPTSAAGVSAITKLAKPFAFVTLQGKFTKGDLANCNGVNCIPLTDSTGSTIYVADSKAHPYIVQVTTTAASPMGAANLRFDDFGTATLPAVPSGAIAISK